MMSAHNMLLVNMIVVVISILFLNIALQPISVYADIYMHNPRGSNNRNCETNDNRVNNNRLFNSENNDAGGYACPRAWPFNCASPDAGEGCSSASGLAGPLGVESSRDDAVVTPRMYYYEGSILPIEWTNQHGCGNNPRVHCDVVIQYACEDTLTDDCGLQLEDRSCGPRDGTPTTNNQDNVVGRATDTIPDTAGAAQMNYAYGRHETYAYYQRCKARERNMGLYIADQNLNNRNRAINTRQNPGGTRYGFECPEEHDYYPYWHDSPWKDIAVLTDRTDRCSWVRRESQNVKAKNECSCPGCNPVPNNERECTAQGGEWIEYPSHNISPPDCLAGPATRENHLGNPVGDPGYMGSVYNWTIPSLRRGGSSGQTVGESCVLRIRYNITSTDYDGYTLDADSTVPDMIFDRQNSEERAYVGFDDIQSDPEISPGARLGLAVNTNQYGRTFEDRSYLFSIKPRPSGGPCGGKTIYNMNVRGKRGNIVQAYPAVEYDFVPSYLHLTDNDCVHLQWTGSDYNPNRAPNNGFGGPPDPRNNNQFRADRHNLVQVERDGDSHPIQRLSETRIFNFEGGRDKTNATSLAFINQPIWDRSKCLTITELIGLESDRNRRDAMTRNCGKLSGAVTPYFDAGLLRPGSPGTYTFMSTRDHSLSNRDMKGTLVVRNGFWESTAFHAILGIGIILGFAGVGYVVIRKRRNSMGRNSTGSGSGFGSYFRRESPAGASAAASGTTGAVIGKSNGGKAKPPARGAAAMGKKRTVVTALYTHTPSEPGELGFKKGAKIVVLKKDASGWWEGEHNGERGIFPSNYIQE